MNEIAKVFKKINLEIETEMNTEINEDDFNYSKNQNNKRFLTPNRFCIHKIKNIFPIENDNPKNYNNNLTLNYFYNKNKGIFKGEELFNNMNSSNQLTTSFGDINSNNIKFLSNINFSENAIKKYQNIYTLVGTKIIGFNLKKKKFILIKQIDETNNLFNENIIFLRKNNILPTTLNHYLGFFILLNNYLFFYSPVNNTLNICEKLSTNHWSGGFISINNNIYSISGKNTVECELYSLDKKKVFNLPSVNYKRNNSGICNVNNEFIYTLFGRDSDNSIERLNIGKNGFGGKNWEIIKIKIDIGNNLYLNCLQQFLSFYNDDNIIILGGDYHAKDENQEILRLNIKDNYLDKIGFINLKTLYINQITFIDDEFFAVYDINSGLHFFNKDLDQHIIFNFQI